MIKGEPAITCMACDDTGRNSKGGVCHPCHKKGRQPLRDAVLGVVTELFAERWESSTLPNEEEVVEAVKWAYQPPVTYAAGYKDPDGGMGMFAGPDPSLDEILKATPAKDPKGHTPYIVRLIRTTRREPTIFEPVARWKEGRWQQKKRSL